MHHVQPVLDFLRTVHDYMEEAFPKFFLEHESRNQQPLIFTHEYNHLQNEGMVDRRT